MTPTASTPRPISNRAAAAIIVPIIGSVLVGAGFLAHHQTSVLQGKTDRILSTQTDQVCDAFMERVNSGERIFPGKHSTKVKCADGSTPSISNTWIVDQFG